MSKTVVIQAIQFSISTQISSICPIDRNLSVANTVDLGAMAMKRY